MRVIAKTLHAVQLGKDLITRSGYPRSFPKQVTRLVLQVESALVEDYTTGLKLLQGSLHLFQGPCSRGLRVLQNKVTTTTLLVLGQLEGELQEGDCFLIHLGAILRRVEVE